MYDVVQTKEFERWHKGLRDSRAVARVTTAVERLQLGLIGDYKSVGGGISEIRITYGPGYRLYYTMKGKQLVILLCGGDKSNQKRDIARARKLRNEYDV
jgi:putative addiction module killer protein